jgi:hypothetical protein
LTGCKEEDELVKVIIDNMLDLAQIEHLKQEAINAIMEVLDMQVKLVEEQAKVREL